MMSTTLQSGYVQARIDPTLKREAVDVLDRIGLSVSDFIKLSFSQVARDKAVQFELKLLSEDTPEHYEEVKSVDHFKQLIGF